jgi:L-lactate dehydrogenase complex protein LldG
VSRAAILGAIQRGLKRGPLPAHERAMLAARLAAHARHTIPARAQVAPAARAAQFTAYVEREYGTVARVATLAGVPGAIAAWLAQHNLSPALVVSPHPLLARVPFGDTPLLATRIGTATPADPVSLTAAFAGIAETGTLMLPSGPERPTSNNLLPDNAIVLLRTADIVGAYEDAFDLLRARPDDGAAAAAQSESGRIEFPRPDDEAAAAAKSESGRADDQAASAAQSESRRAEFPRPDDGAALAAQSESGRADDQAAAAAQSESGRINYMPRNVMLVTGPSRSADIEQTLELGAHGPRRLHILLLDGEG